jgi:hypothetical protein
MCNWKSVKMCMKPGHVKEREINTLLSVYMTNNIKNVIMYFSLHYNLNLRTLLNNSRTTLHILKINRSKDL